MLNRGFTLIEVLVTLVILTFGLLGIAGLMAKGQRASFEAFERQQAVALASDMAERVRANRTQAVAYSTAARSNNPAGTGDFYKDLLIGNYTDCGTALCTPADLAAFDVAVWDGLLTGYSEAVIVGNTKVGGIVKARGCIDETANTLGSCPGGGFYTRALRVSVAWQGNEDTVAPTVSTCGQNLYPSETKRRVAVLDLMVLQTCP